MGGIEKRCDVVVVGAGVAGCYFSRLLGESGFSVYLLEQKAASELGYPWWDNIWKPIFEEIPLAPPSQEELFRTGDITFCSPLSGTQFLTRDSGLVYAVDRAKFGQRLLKEALSAGIQFSENCTVEGPLVDLENNTVTGIQIKGGDQLNARLVVDCSGVHGVIRSNLPFQTEFDKVIQDENIFTTYREIRKKKPGVKDTRFLVYPARNGGLCWASFLQEGLVDFFAGGFASKQHMKSPEEAVREMVKEFSEHCRDELIVGLKEPIPVRRPLNSFVENGMMIIGNAACQCHPIFGSGIASSLYGAHLAAGIAIEALKNNNCSKVTLWAYNVAYHHSEINKAYTFFDVIKSYLSTLTEHDFEYLFSNKIVDIGVLWRKRELHKPRGFINNAKLLYHAKRKIPMLLRLSKRLKKANRVKEICSQYPESYSKKALASWRKRLERCYL